MIHLTPGRASGLPTCSSAWAKSVQELNERTRDHRIEAALTDYWHRSTRDDGFLRTRLYNDVQDARRAGRNFLFAAVDCELPELSAHDFHVLPRWMQLRTPLDAHAAQRVLRDWVAAGGEGAAHAAAPIFQALAFGEAQALIDLPAGLAPPDLSGAGFAVIARTRGASTPGRQRPIDLKRVQDLLFDWLADRQGYIQARAAIASEIVSACRAGQRCVTLQCNEPLPAIHGEGLTTIVVVAPHRSGLRDAPGCGWPDDQILPQEASVPSGGKAAWRPAEHDDSDSTDSDDSSDAISTCGPDSDIESANPARLARLPIACSVPLANAIALRGLLDDIAAYKSERTFNFKQRRKDRQPLTGREKPAQLVAESPTYDCIPRDAPRASDADVWFQPFGGLHQAPAIFARLDERQLVRVNLSLDCKRVACIDDHHGGPASLDVLQAFEAAGVITRALVDACYPRRTHPGLTPPENTPGGPSESRPGNPSAS